MDEYQSLINWLILGVSIVSSVIGWFVRVLWDAVAVLKNDIKSIEVLLPNEYVKQSNFDRIMERFDKDRHTEHDEVMTKLESINSKFDRVYDKLEHKADK